VVDDLKAAAGSAHLRPALLQGSAREVRAVLPCDLFELTGREPGTVVDRLVLTYKRHTGWSWNGRRIMGELAEAAGRAAAD
jgi:hypothetical protein